MANAAPMPVTWLAISLCFISSHSFITSSLGRFGSVGRNSAFFASSSSSSISYDDFRQHARSKFPFFHPQLANEEDQFDSTGWRFFDNAGGSQVPQVVVDASTNGIAVRWRDVVGSEHTSKAREVAAAMLGTDKGNVIFGSSASTLLRAVAMGYSQLLQPGDEVIVCDWAHESQIAPWILAAELSQATVKWCHIDRKGGGKMPSPQDIAKMCGPRTKLVTLTHVSNVLGTVYDVKETTKLVKSKCNADVVVDGVAFVPHMTPQVEEIGCDWYVFSCYKAFGPHTAAMYGSKQALTKLKSVSQNHKFVKPSSIGPERWELGTSNQEGAAAMRGLAKYFRDMAAFGEGCDMSHEKLSHVIPLAYKHMNQAEEAVGEAFLQYLGSNPKVKVIGNPTMKERVATISLVHSDLKAKDVCALAQKQKIICRYGLFQSPRLLEAIGVPDPYGDGVLRFSFVHYNTMEDVDKVIAFLKSIGF